MPSLRHCGLVYQNNKERGTGWENFENALGLLLKSNEAKCGCLCSLNANLPSC